jgi:phosphatidate cytidylyltransferase
MLTRILSGLTLIVVVLVVLLALPTEATFVLAAAVVALAAHEYVRLATPDAGAIGFAAVLASVATALCLAYDAPVQAVLLAGLIVTGSHAIGRGRTGEEVVKLVGVALSAPLYVGVPVGMMLAFRVEFGPLALLAGLLTVMASDVAQLFGGRAFGRHPLAPVVSPKKTIEGAVAGVAAAAVVLPVLAHWWLPALDAWRWAAIGGVVGLLGIAGDLFESLIKRSAGVKDSSALIPGHGGMLDRIDALLFAVPLLYVAVRAICG